MPNDTLMSQTATATYLGLSVLQFVRVRNVFRDLPASGAFYSKAAIDDWLKDHAGVNLKTVGQEGYGYRAPTQDFATHGAHDQQTLNWNITVEGGQERRYLPGTTYSEPSEEEQENEE